MLFGYGDDPCLDAVTSAAADVGMALLLVDQRLAADTELIVDVMGGSAAGTVTVAGEPHRLSEVTGVYARPLTPVYTPDPRANERSRMLRRAFVEWFEVADTTVLNRPSAMLSNASKPFQAQLISAAGFAVPATLITNDPDEATDFWHEHGEVVYKSISGIRSIVRQLDAEAAARLARVRDLPTQFQERIDGTDVRVHVVGARVFATEVRSAAVDYRYARHDGLPADLVATSLPDEIADRCVRLAATLRLPFCGIDLRRRPDNAYVCFEANPMPGFSYYESHTGQPISLAVCALLAEEARRSDEPSDR